MNCVSISTHRSTIAMILYFVLTTAIATHSASGEQPSNAEAAVEIANSEPPPRSLLEDSYGYHRLGMLPENASYPAASPARNGGWYRYGFPMQAHRWGWFGAEHYYPRVLWHRGYYGDRCRWSYRRGY